MIFPLRVGPLLVTSAQELGALARRDARPGGTVVPGLRVWQWVVRLTLEGTVDRASASALAAGLIRIPDAATIAEGARLAVALGDSAVADLLASALTNHDVALMLAPDPADPTHSVEDAVLQAVVALADLSDPATRQDILLRLRNAALRTEEMAVLCRWGSDEDLLTWLPAVLTEGVPEEARSAVERRLAKKDEGSARIASLVPESDRTRR